MKLGIIQPTVYENKQLNLSNAKTSITRLAQEGADMVVLPEMFNCPYQERNFPIYAETQEGDTVKLLSSVAKENNIYVVGGSIPERQGDKIFNTSFVFNRYGNIIAKHRKMHLFDICVKNGQKFNESDTLTAGDTVTVFDTEFCRMGLCICYDIRFPELWRLMVDDGAKIVIVPGAFNMTTGPKHWTASFTQRAVDNQIFTIGVAPARDSNGCYVSFANSIVVSPWGDVVAQLDEKPGTMLVDVDLPLVEKIRAQLPLLKHRRNDIYQIIKCKK